MILGSKGQRSRLSLGLGLTAIRHVFELFECLLVYKVQTQQTTVLIDVSSRTEDIPLPLYKQLTFRIFSRWLPSAILNFEKFKFWINL